MFKRMHLSNVKNRSVLKPDNKWVIAWRLLCVWFIVLISAHYLKAQPLWLDEQFIFNSIVNRSPTEIFQLPLLNLQQFPKFYLWCIQSLTHLVNNQGVLVVRLLPFIAMAMAFIVWQKVAVKAGLSIRERVLFTACWTASLQLIYYAAELKQYSFDVLAAGLCTLWLISPSRPRWVYCLPLLGLFSYTVFLFFPLIMLVIVFDEKGNIYRSFRCWLIASMMVSSIVLVYLFDMKNGNGEILRKYWVEYFISFDSVGEFFRSIGEGFNNLISRWFGDMPKWLRIPARPIVGCGLIWLIINGVKQIRREGIKRLSIDGVGVLILGMHVILGMLHLYAFVVPRTSLFVAPFLLLATAGVWGFLYRKQPTVAHGFLILIGCYFVFISSGIAYAMIKHHHLGAQQYLWQI